MSEVDRDNGSALVVLWGEKAMCTSCLYFSYLKDEELEHSEL